MTAAKQEHKLASYKEYAERWHPSLGVVEIWCLVVHTVFLPGGLKCVAKLNLRQKCKDKVKEFEAPAAGINWFSNNVLWQCVSAVSYDNIFFIIMCKNPEL